MRFTLSSMAPWSILPVSSCLVLNLSVLSTAVTLRATQIIHDCKSEKQKENTLYLNCTARKQTSIWIKVLKCINLQLTFPFLHHCFRLRESEALHSLVAWPTGPFFTSRTAMAELHQHAAVKRVTLLTGSITTPWHTVGTLTYIQKSFALIKWHHELCMNSQRATFT